MVSQMAKEDFYALKNKGVEVAYEDIIKLNALGTRAESSEDSYSFFAIPRCVFLKVEGEEDVVLREPTIAHEIWFDSVQRSFDLEDGMTLLGLRLYMLSRDADELPKWYHISQVTKSISKFLQKEVKEFTVRQLLNAMRYCEDGTTFNVDEEFLKETDEKEEIEMEKNISLEIGIMRQAQAIGLGVSVGEMEKMTKSDLQKLILMKYEENKIDVSKRIKDEAIQNYYTLLQRIKDKAKEDKENG